ncbi:MAG: NUDIX domain-containing protein [Clostridia bacterium]|nr:NUDIX domain-containing protein [Clostridia bacterium]
MEKIEVAGAILLDKDNKILLIHRNTAKMQRWELPGGKLEKGEIPKATTIRELKEELDIDVKPLKYVGFKVFEENDVILKYHWYKCKIDNGIPKLLEEKFDDISYFSKEELFQLLKDNKLSSNMQVLISNIDIEKI